LWNGAREVVAIGRILMAQAASGRAVYMKKQWQNASIARVFWMCESRGMRFVVTDALRAVTIGENSKLVRQSQFCAATIPPILR
jgi:hypothetical protein